ncbi:hypothetical protein LCGC14_1044150 [marine sediment metagenome]|uniref:Uncharacterized protein n=1 Tax=marine sediment metagenome TaxID=412755 RepID=A0A0F9MV95_9ZZZZ
MKRFLLMLLIILLPALAFADARINKVVTTTTEYTSSQLIQTGVTNVYRVYFIPSSNGGWFALHNCLTIGAAASTNAKVEGMEATAFNGQPQDFTSIPVEFSTGLFLDIYNGSILIEYE